jgi:hypothetical protein
MQQRLISQLLDQVDVLKKDVTQKRQAAAARSALSLPVMVSPGFDAPTPYPTPSGSFLFRMLSIDDVVKDHEAVTSSVEPLTHIFAEQVRQIPCCTSLIIGLCTAG